MTSIRNHRLKSLPIANYSSAIATALEWLGDRYLLAKPIKAVRSRANTGDVTHDRPDGEFGANPRMLMGYGEH
jgi:hypothetical protein